MQDVMHGELLKAKKWISSMAVDAEGKRNFLIFSSFTKKAITKQKQDNQSNMLCEKALCKCFAQFFTRVSKTSLSKTNTSLAYSSIAGEVMGTNPVQV